MMQAESSECGLACLAMIVNHFKGNVDLAELRRRFPISLKGATMAHLMSHAAALNFNSRPLRLEMAELGQLQLPCILHWNLNHFVVLEKIGKNHAVVLDPAIGRRKLSLSEVSAHFTGVALELAPGSTFEAPKEVKKIQLGSLMGTVYGLKRSMVQIFLLAAVLELFAVLAPLLNQLVVDDAIATHDMDLLKVCLIGFGLLMVIQTAVGLARSWAVMTLSQSLSVQWAGNVFAHLTKLPSEFFEKRHVGDIVSRFGSVNSIQATLTTSAVEAVLDGLMAIASLAMMLAYSPSLTLVVLLALSAYGLIRWLSYSQFRNAASERLIVAARESSYFMETLRAIAPLKLFGQEYQRRAKWQNLRVEVQNRDTRSAKWRMAISTANALIFGTANLTLLWLGASLVMETTDSRAAAPFTIGMLFAFLAYREQFSGRVTALIDYCVEIRMLNLHADRLADIVLTPPEAEEVQQNDLKHLEPTIELRNVGFQYAEGEPWVLRNVNLVLRAGESVAITGASGSGKSTLLKILLGLRLPQEGEVLYGGVPIKTLGLQNYRKLVGSVLQEDALLSGSIEDNICFFDAAMDRDRVQACAKEAAIHKDVATMPMGYQTMVRDMGSSLSGGQKQRVLLARALYKQPRVLVLDEATSHLDIENERLVNESLSRQKITRIVVAHRPETIAAAQRVVSVAAGGVSESETLNISRIRVEPLASANAA
ncbi:peptidase domain-containing ABC transporter [Roseateles asaccharophilus]|uniref:peptidase domain-containing ABC transporter n=1 Tax=Roseateles asaccharophilus TaxID=582607 RepID=UPI00384F7FDC